MRILLLADSDSAHTINWAKSLSAKGITLGIFSLHSFNSTLYDDSKNIQLFGYDVNRRVQQKNETSFSKSIYFFALQRIKKIIKEFKPDILHAHYLSSYGLLGALSGFKPLIISVWGSDIFQFPNHSFLHRASVKYSLNRADRILSTSKIMKEEILQYTNKDVIVTPFGIDTEVFYPHKTKTIFSNDELVIGSVKTLETNYGIEYLINAFHIIKQNNPEKKFKLLIVGKGSQKPYLEELSNKLGLQNEIVFTGFVKYDEIQVYQNMIDIAVIPSINESFGVSALEASACGKPVVASNVGGLKEVVDNGETGFLVEKQNSEAIAEALQILINNNALRNLLGENGRNKVISEFNQKDCVQNMISIYKNTVNVRE